MNREVKFRGKSKKTDEWLFGNLVRNVEGAFAIVPPFGTTTDNLCDRYEVDEDTIGQFTGCYDSQGTSIWEGDIVVKTQSKTNNRYPVTFSDGTFCIRLRDDIEAPLKMFDMKDVTVIGNIYDNPRIIKTIMQ